MLETDWWKRYSRKDGDASAPLRIIEPMFLHRLL